MPQAISRAGTVMLLMGYSRIVSPLRSGSRADAAAAKLKAMISVTATVVRNAEAREIPISHLVRGDIVQLSAGDMIPADVRLISAKDLFIIQATLTGESLPVEKMKRRTRVKASACWSAATPVFWNERRERHGQGSRDGDRLVHLLRSLAAALPANKRKRVSTAASSDTPG